MAPIFTSLQTITDTKAGDHQTILSTNTPLSAPENDMTTVTDSLYDQVLGSSGADTSSLAWLLPTVIGAVVAMIILGLLLFYGVHALELKMLRWCRSNCSCCYGESEERSALTASYGDRETEMKRYKYKSSSATSPD